MIKISNLNFGYTKKRLLFNTLNLDLQSGHVYGLLGKNGAGKSTLLHLVSGLLYPHSGNLTVFGKSPFLREASLFLMPEEFYAL